MCSRFHKPPIGDELLELLPGLQLAAELGESFNVAPTDQVPTVLNDGRIELTSTRWGLIPSWAKDASIGPRLVNARAEGIEAKPSFRTPLKKRRCLMLAQGFYEWDQTTRAPYYFKLQSGKPFAFAGPWDIWEDPATRASVRTCTIITCVANELVGRHHHRMPVILPREIMMEWITPSELTAQNALKFLQQYPAAEMECHPVSPRVGNVRNEGPDLLQSEQGELF